MGWNGSDLPQKVVATSSKPQTSASSRGRRALVLGIAVVLAGGIAAYWLCGSSEKKMPRVPSVGPAASAGVTADGVTETGKKGNDPLQMPKVERKPPQERTRADIPPPEPLADVVEKVKKPKHLFSTETESYISMAIPSEVGYGVPPVPIPEGTDFSKDMQKAFKSKILVEEGDDEETLKRKEIVLQAKEELQELAEKENWTLQEFVNALRNKFIRDEEYLVDCHETMEKAYADPEVSDESYVAIRDKINATLKERGLPEIKSTDEAIAELEEAEALKNEKEGNKE